MARRRRKHEEHENLERWLVSYADFITLLFAFFVVMYAVSSVNEGKYRVLSETLNAVFADPARSDKPIQIGEPPRDILALPDGPLAPNQSQLEAGGKGASGDVRVDAVPGDKPTEAAAGRGPKAADDATLRAADQIAIAMDPYIKDGLVNVKQSRGRIEIEMKERMLFGSGDTHLSPTALRALRTLAKTLLRLPSNLQVEGHTDNLPIATPTYPSNWELSAARAASVVHFLARAGVEPWRMSAVGMGEHHPIAENDTEKGRAANRRVTIVLLTGARQGKTAVDDDVPWAEGPALEAR